MLKQCNTKKHNTTRVYCIIAKSNITQPELQHKEIFTHDDGITCDTLRTFAGKWDRVFFWPLVALTSFLFMSSPCLLTFISSLLLLLLLLSDLLFTLETSSLSTTVQLVLAVSLFLFSQSYLPRVPSVCQFLSPLTLIFCFFLYILLPPCRTFPVSPRSVVF